MDFISSAGEYLYLRCGIVEVDSVLESWNLPHSDAVLEWAIHRCPGPGLRNALAANDVQRKVLARNAVEMGTLMLLKGMAQLK